MMFLYNYFIINYIKIVKFLCRYCIYDTMEYKNNDPFESNNGSGLIIFITAISMVVSLLGIVVCFSVTNL